MSLSGDFLHCNGVCFHFCWSAGVPFSDLFAEIVSSVWLMLYLVGCWIGVGVLGNGAL